MKTQLYFVSKYLIMLLVLIRFAEEARSEDRLFPVSVSVLNQSWGFPFSEFARVSPLYPGLTAGIYRLRHDKLFSFPQSAHAGYYYNNNSGSAFFLYGDQSIRFAPRCGFYIDIALGLGYFHGFHAGENYSRNSENRYEKITDWGKPGMMLSLSQTIGLDLSRKFGIPLAPFIKNQWIFSTPYFDMVIPVKPGILSHIGTLIYF